MKFSTKTFYFSKLLICIAIVMLTGIYSCNDSASNAEKEVPPPSADTAMKAADTMMKMSTDTMVSDSSNKGGQPTPTGH